MPLVPLPILLATQALANPWPADTDWVPVVTGAGGTITDPAGDSGGGSSSFDIVGLSPDSAGFAYQDATTAYFRVRLADSPQQSLSKWESFAFYVLMESDGVIGSTYDVGVFLKGQSDEVILGANSSPTNTWCADSVAQTFSYTAPADFSGYARVVPAGTAYGGAADQFLDIQVPLVDLETVTGLAVHTANFGRAPRTDLHRKLRTHFHKRRGIHRKKTERVLSGFEPFAFHHHVVRPLVRNEEWRLV